MHPISQTGNILVFVIVEKVQCSVFSRPNETHSSSPTKLPSHHAGQLGACQPPCRRDVVVSRSLCKLHEEG